MPTSEYFLGMLSGTSIDGIDCALVDFASTPPSLIATHTEQIPRELRLDLLQLCSGKDISLALLGQTDVIMGRLFAKAANSLLDKCNLRASDIIAIGSHGQTVHHCPAGQNRFTLQIGDPNTICKLTGISTVADFRRMDMANGGQGAPLTPLFHQSFFSDNFCRRAILNIGGIANISLLCHDSNSELTGFDTGPGNVLLDSWITLKHDKPYDDAGEWAATGKSDQRLLDVLTREDFFRLPPPKSTGRELFNLDWLKANLARLPLIKDEDVQATLLEFTARTISDSVNWQSHRIEELVVCGGGAHNTALMKRLEELVSPVSVISSEQRGLSPDWVEAVAFAWMARKTWRREPIATGSVTGAQNPCILGGIYSAGPHKL